MAKAFSIKQLQQPGARENIMSNKPCSLGGKCHANCLFDCLSFSRNGESSDELSSVMIINPMIGTTL
jgi:hypothetical protein